MAFYAASDSIRQTIVLRNCCPGDQEFPEPDPPRDGLQPCVCNCLADRRHQLFDGCIVTRNSMAFPVVKQRRIVLVADTVQGHCAVEVWVQTADNVACRDVDHVFAFVCKDGLDLAIFDLAGWPTGKKYAILASYISLSFLAVVWGVP